MILHLVSWQKDWVLLQFGYADMPDAVVLDVLVRLVHATLQAYEVRD